MEDNLHILRKNYQKKCFLFNYYAAPYLGYYHSDNYHLLEPSKIIEIQDYHIFNSFQPKMVNIIESFLKDNPGTDIQNVELYFDDFNPNEWNIKKRTNIVMHLLPMKDKVDLADEGFDIQAVLFTDNTPWNFGVTKYNIQPETLQFNMNKLDDSSRVHIYFHDKEFLSPNNCAVFINHAYQFLSFGLVCAYKSHTSSNYQLFSALFFINNTSRIVKDLSTTNPSLKDQFFAYQALVNRELQKLIENKISKSFNSSLSDDTENHLEKDFFGKIGSYEDHLYEFLWNLFDCPMVGDFGKCCYEKVGLKLQIIFLALYAFHLLANTLKSICYKLTLEGYKTDDFKKDNRILLENLMKTAETQIDNTSQLPNALDYIITCLKADNSQEAADTLSTLDEFFQGYIFERSWTWRGQKLGISFFFVDIITHFKDVCHDYGKIIFLGSGDDSSDSHLEREEKIMILETFYRKLDLNSYKETIAILE